ncbi:MAG: hypothetical protein ACK4YP_02075 [Myxococcota bacterium]
MIENAYARFVIRGTYAALTRLEEEGGTVVDAAVPGGTDVLLEYLPEADRTAIVAVNEDGEARLELPGVTYRLGADDDVLWIDGATEGSLQGVPDAFRTGSTLVDGDDAFLGADGFGFSGGSALPLTEVTRLALSPEGLWPDGERYTLEVDADLVAARLEGAEVARVEVVDGVLDTWLPAGVTFQAEREGCAYEGITPRGCGFLQLRVADDAGNDLPAIVSDGRGLTIPVPKGGGRVPLGPDPKRIWVWAGPAYTAAQLSLPGGDSEGAVTLHRAFDTDNRVLAAMAVEVAPDAGSATAPLRATSELAAEGVGFVVLLADDEVASAEVDAHDDVFAVAGSRAAEAVYSWPWSPNGRKAAHGAVPWQGLGALDLLAAMEGGRSAGRLTVVEPFWIQRAVIEADPDAWDPRPDAVWLKDLMALQDYLTLLDAWVDVAPVGPRTWIETEGDDNVAAYEAGIVDGRTTAGTGPRLALSLLEKVEGGWKVDVTLDAPRWMGMYEVALWTKVGDELHPVEGPGRWKWTVPDGATYVVAVAKGRSARPWEPVEAWAVSAPLWIARP